jgi:hypothetical protein
MSPNFNDPFSAAYDEVACHRDDLPTYRGCYVYTPDNYDDYQCLAVWQPDPELGAREWIRNGKRILIGVYRDEGRRTQRQPSTAMTWTLSGTVLTVTTSRPHRLAVGDDVQLFNTVEADITLSVSAVITATQFTVVSPTSGVDAQAGAYSPVKEVDFLNDYVVFRLLPTFKPVPVSMIRAILAAAEPELSRSTVTLTDVVSGSMQVKSEVQTYTSSMLNRRHRQQLDELKRPLRQVYDARGRVVPPDLRFSKNANAALYFNVPMVSQWNPIPSANPYLPAHDFYGFPLNDAARGPFFANDIVYYDSSTAFGISRRVNGSTAIYDGVIHDVFGDYVVGARANNTLISRKPVQPLLVDHHNTPYKRALRRG